MSNGNGLEIEVDLQTLSAAQAMRGLLDAVTALEGKVDSFGRSVDDAQKRVDAMGEAAAGAGRGLDQAGRGAQDAGKGLDAMGDAARKATADLAGGAGKARNEVDQTKEKTSRLKEATEGVTGSVMQWVGSYLGLQGATKLLSIMEEKMRGILAAQKELVGGKWQQDEATKDVQRNLGLEGKAGEDKARNLVTRMAKSTAGDFAQSAGTVAAANSFNFDTDTDKGWGVAEEVGKFSTRAGVDGVTIQQIFKLLSNLGVKDREGARLVLAKLEEVFKKTGESSLGAFVGNALGGIGGILAKGSGIKDLDRALGVYSTMSSGARSVEAGADQTRMLSEMADATDDKDRAFLAAEARKRGLTKSREVGAGDVDEFMKESLKGPKPGQSMEEFTREHPLRSEAIELVRREERLAHLKAEDVDAEAKYKNHLRYLRRTHRVRDIPIATREYEEARRHRAETEADMESGLAETREKLRQELQYREDRRGFAAVSNLDRVALIQTIASEAKTPEQKEKLRAAMGGAPERFQAASLFGTEAYASRQREAEAAARAADPSKLEGRNQRFRETSPAENNLATTQRGEANAGAVGGGMEFAERFAADAAAETTRAKTKMSWWGQFTAGSGGAGRGLNFTDSSFQYQVARHRLAKQVLRFWMALTPAERRDSGMAAWAQGMFNELMGSQEIKTGSAGMSAVNRYANEFGRLRSEILRKRHNRGDYSIDDADTLTGQDDTTPEGMDTNVVFSLDPDRELPLDQLPGGWNLAPAAFRARLDRQRQPPPPPASPPWAAPAGAAGAGPAGGERPGASVIYNITTHVGQVFGGGGLDADPAGRLEGLS